MEFEYKTIAKQVGDVLLKEKGSKFISYAYPVSTETEMLDKLEETRRLHPKATHHCYAFRLGLSGDIFRANDDGEPSGSAGLPIYNQILGHELTNVLVVVVRYYGGTKLGVGGLVKIYKESSKEVLSQAKIITKELHKNLKLSFPYSGQSAVYQIINKYDLEILSLEQNQWMVITVKIPMRAFTEMESLFANLKDVKAVAE